MAKKEKKELEGVIITTPIVPTGYNHLNSPDEYKGKKTFKTDLIFKPDELSELQEEIEEVIDKKFDEVISEIKSASKRKKVNKKYPWREEEDDEGEPTGNFIITAKSNPKPNGKRRFPVVDSRNNETTVLVWGGSKIRVEIYFKPYFMPTDSAVGVTPYIQAVQIVELAGDAGGGGYRGSFSKIEDGFVSEDDDDDVDDQVDDDDDEDEGEDDF